MSDRKLASIYTERLSTTLTAACGLVSGCMTLGLLGYLVWSAYFRKSHGSTNAFRTFLHTDAGRYLVSLLLADLCHSVGYVSGLQWVRTGIVVNGPGCTAQGVLLELGDIGTVIWVIAMSFHTLIHVFFSSRPPVWFGPLVLLLGWSIMFLMPTIGSLVIARKGDSFFDAGGSVWCWVSDSYPVEQLLYYFVWSMVAVGFSIISYTLVFIRGSRFWGRGLVFSNSRSQLDSSLGGGNSTQHLSPPNLPPSKGEERESARSVARKLILYPIAYTILTMPLTVSSLMIISGTSPPLWYSVFATCILALDGAIDTVLFLFTRRSFIRSATRSLALPQSIPNSYPLEGIFMTRHEFDDTDGPRNNDSLDISHSMAAHKADTSFGRSLYESPTHKPIPGYPS